MLPRYEIVTTTAKAISIRDNVVNEIMHNPVGPWAEANALYIDQSNLKTRILEAGDSELVIFDIGLGAAANALAALACFINLPGRTHQKLKIISFEKNLDLLRFALLHANQFAHFAGFEDAIRTLLETNRWQTENLVWELRHGDFLELLETEVERPHIVFFDPYSPKMNQEVWTTNSFQKLFAKSRSNSEGGTVLYTYSQATPVRSAMLMAGFFVGYGQRTGLKSETTQAATDLKLLHTPVGIKWFERWKRSQSPYPYDCSEADQPRVAEVIQKHSQFSE